MVCAAIQVVRWGLNNFFLSEDLEVADTLLHLALESFPKNPRLLLESLQLKLTGANGDPSMYESTKVFVTTILFFVSSSVRTFFLAKLTSFSTTIPGALLNWDVETQSR